MLILLSARNHNQHKIKILSANYWSGNKSTSVKIAWQSDNVCSNFNQTQLFVENKTVEAGMVMSLIFWDARGIWIDYLKREILQIAPALCVFSISGFQRLLAGADLKKMFHERRFGSNEVLAKTEALFTNRKKKSSICYNVGGMVSIEENYVDE